MKTVEKLIQWKPKTVRKWREYSFQPSKKWSLLDEIFYLKTHHNDDYRMIERTTIIEEKVIKVDYSKIL